MSNAKKILFARFDVFKADFYPSSEDNDDMLRLRLWILVNSAATALDEQEREWYAARILPLMADLRLGTPSEVDLELNKYIWTSTQSAMFLNSTWPELEHRLQGLSIEP